MGASEKKTDGQVRVKARLKQQTRGVKSAYQMECKGGTKWFSKSLVSIHFGGYMDIPQWLYDKSPDFYEIV